MKLAAMQPYFFPYLGHFDLLNQVDMWVAYHSAQYIRHGWVNRNRVLHAKSGWQYITVPLKKHSYTASIQEIEIAGEAWKKQVFKQLEHYHMDAPFYKPVIHFLEDALSVKETQLAKLNVALFCLTAARLEIPTPIHMFSEMVISTGSAKGPEELALAICRATGASEYINPPGGNRLVFRRRICKVRHQTNHPGF